MVSSLTMENSMWGVFHNQAALCANDKVHITLPKIVIYSEMFEYIRHSMSGSSIPCSTLYQINYFSVVAIYLSLTYYLIDYYACCKYFFNLAS